MRATADLPALVVAVDQGCAEWIAPLVSAGADPTRDVAFRSGGETPLAIASRHDDPAAITALLAAGAVPYALPVAAGPPWGEVICLGSTQSAQALLDGGIDPLSEDAPQAWDIVRGCPDQTVQVFVLDWLRRRDRSEPRLLHSTVAHAAGMSDRDERAGLLALIGLLRGFGYDPRQPALWKQWDWPAARTLSALDLARLLGSPDVLEALGG